MTTQKRSLGELAIWSSGGTPSKSNPRYWNGNIPWISASSMKTGRLEQSDRTLTTEGLNNGSRLANAGDVLLLVRGSELHKRIPVGIAQRDLAFNQDVKALKPNRETTSKYLYYWLCAKEKLLLSKVEQTGIGAGKLDTELLKSLEIELPTLNHQNIITGILGSLDNKIELNRRTSQTLEAMAQAIFKSWFVDFDPVKAKIAALEQGEDPLRAAMRTISGKTDDELDQLPREQYDGLVATAELFPDVMEESELGEIPEGWIIKELGSLCSLLNRGITPKYIENGGVLVLNQKCIRNFKIDASKGRRHDQKKKAITAKEVFVGDILINSTGTGTLGRIAQITHLTEQTTVDSHITIVRANDELSPIYIGQYMRWIQPTIEALGEGSTGQTELSRSKLASLKLTNPPKNILHSFSRIISPLLQITALIEQETENLQKTRNLLLPELMSGSSLVRTLRI